MDLSEKIKTGALTVTAKVENEGETNEYTVYNCTDSDGVWQDSFRVDKLNTEKTDLTAKAEAESDADNKAAINRRITEINALLDLVKNKF